MPGINAAANGAGIEAATTRQGTVPGINTRPERCRNRGGDDAPRNCARNQRRRERCRNRGGDDAPRNCARNQRRPRTVPGSRRHAVLGSGHSSSTHSPPADSEPVGRAPRRGHPRPPPLSARTTAPKRGGVTGPTGRAGAVRRRGDCAELCRKSTVARRRGTVPRINRGELDRHAGPVRCRNQGGDDAPRNCARNQRRPRTVPGSMRRRRARELCPESTPPRNRARLEAARGPWFWAQFFATLTDADDSSCRRREAHVDSGHSSPRS